MSSLQKVYRRQERRLVAVRMRTQEITSNVELEMQHRRVDCLPIPRMVLNCSVLVLVVEPIRVLSVQHLRSQLHCPQESLVHPIHEILQQHDVACTTKEGEERVGKVAGVQR